MVGLALLLDAGGIAVAPAVVRTASCPERSATARGLVHRTPVALMPEDNLETALRLCEMNDEEHMPVVDNGQNMRVIGEVRYQDLVLAYNRALLAARAAERGER
jgi:predicted transcriptional regulator